MVYNHLFSKQTNLTVTTNPVKHQIETCFSKEELQNFISEEEQTIIHCRYISPSKYVNGGWINIWPTTYLCPNGEDGRLPLLHVLEVPLHPNKHYFKRSREQYHFTLIFPVIPKEWHLFHLKEYTDQGDGFVVKQICRNDTGVYRVSIV